MEARKINLDTIRLTIPQIRYLMGELTQTDMGNLIGLTQNQVWQRERDPGKWTMQEVSKISEVSGVPIERISIC